MDNFIVVNTKDKNGNDLKLKVIRPNNRIAHIANMAFNRKQAELIREGGKDGRLLLRSELESELEKLGVWTREDKLRMEKIGIELRTHELLLQRGGLSLNDGRSLAIKMNELRIELFQLYNKRQQFDSSTIESVAADYRFDVMVSECVFYENDQKYFKNYDDYLDKGNDVASVDAAKQLAQMVYGYDPNFSSKFFENKWLKSAKFVDDQGRFVNKEGKFVTKDGQLINIDGKYLNENGQFVDENGNLVNDLGDFLVNDPKPFIDENGNDVIIKVD